MNKNKNKSQINISNEEFNIDIIRGIPKDQYSCTKCKSVPEIKNIDFITGTLLLNCPNEHGEIRINIGEYFKQEFPHLYYSSKCNLGGFQYNHFPTLFAFCTKCNDTFCPDCTNIDITNKRHKAYHIKVNELTNKCPIHFIDFNRYCFKCEKNLCLECKCEHSEKIQIPKPDKNHIDKLKEKKKRLEQKMQLQENLIKFLDTVIETWEKHPLNYYHSTNIENLANCIDLNEGEADANLEALNKLDHLEKKFQNTISEYLNIKLKVDFTGKKINLNGKDLKNEDFKLLSYLELPNAEEIDLSHNKISDTSPLKNLKSPNLKKIDLSYNNIQGIHSIKKDVLEPKLFPVLIEIKLDHNEKILKKDIEEIKNLLKITFIKESELEYELDKSEKQIRLFGENFFKKNQNKCKIKINDNSEKEKIIEFYKYDQYKEEKKILKITLFMKNDVTDISGMFLNCKALKKIISIFDINSNTNINDISELFGGCTSLRELPDSISTWDTSKIENMEGIFYECQSLNYLPDISKWNTSKVNNMMSIFNRCTTLRSLPDISKWNTKSVTNMSNMFINCSSLTEIPRGISGWDTTKVTTMKKMFKGCTLIKKDKRPDISKWHIPSDSKNDMF